MPVVVGLVPLAIYLSTLAPTVTAEDSGELITAAWHFGIPHPPGYPLWTMLCGAFLRIVPFGNVALRANLFSAVCMSAAAVVAYSAVRELRTSRIAAASAAVTWVLTRWAWKQAVITEVYGLNAVLTAGLLWAVLRWYRTRRPRPLVAAAVLAGIGMTNHHQIAFSGLALGLWAFLQVPSLLKDARLLTRCAIAAALGLLPYVYLPVRAAQDPPLNWGRPANWSAFWAHVARKQYGSIGPTRSREPQSPTRLAAQLRYAGAALIEDLTPPVAAIFAAGLLLLTRRATRDISVLMMLWLLANVVLFVAISNYELNRHTRWMLRVFFIPAHLAVVPVLAGLVDWLRARWQPLAVTTAFALPVIEIVSHFRANDYRNYWYAVDNARNMLDSAPQRAMLLPTGDHVSFPLMYLTLVEGYRPDVIIARKGGRLDPTLYRDRPEDASLTPMAWVMRRERRPLCYTWKEPLPIRNARLVPTGMLYRVVLDGQPDPPADRWASCRYRNLAQPGNRDLGADQILAQYYFFGGVESLRNGDVETASSRFARAAEYGDGLTEVINNIGVALGEAGRVNDAISYLRRAAAIDRTNTLARWNLFSLYQRLGNRDAAAQVLDELERIEPDRARIDTARRELKDDSATTQPAGGPNQ